MKNHELVPLILQRLHSKFGTGAVPIDALLGEIALFRGVEGLYDDLDETGWEDLKRELLAMVIITIDPQGGITLPHPDDEDWLADSINDIDFRRWVAYRLYLQRRGFTPSVLAAIDNSTNEILNCLGDPRRDGSWSRRGLVIGDVQSGKTATYIGAVNKAADAGFKLIILLAGGTEALRKQTQLRIDEGIIGRDSSHAPPSNGVTNNNVVGVGEFHGAFVSAQGLTTQATDFRKTAKQAVNIVLNPEDSTPYVFVIKKNKTALDNVRDWLQAQIPQGQAKLDIPMLVVDDESDYASVNTREETDPTVINQRIRQVLQLTTKSSYLAFTATPFANIFIDHETEHDLFADDLFPRNFIRSLDSPSNYVGSEAFFGTEDDTDGSKLVHIADAEDFIPIRHKSHQVVEALPPSLTQAIRAFVVASAIRESKGDSSPRSMLVNVSRFKRVQAQVHELVQAEFENLKHAIDLHATTLAVGSSHHQMAALESVFDRYFGDSGVGWEEVRGSLKVAVHDTRVSLINSDRVKKVNELGELESDRMIAVGGDVLSRGLTLEGLTVSYFHRVVGASDTLLQMARWFGYRPGYENLCRVWIGESVADQFRYVAGIVDELRAQLVEMKKHKKTPRDFGLAVRMHPEALLITARNKAKHVEVQTRTISLAGRKNIETVRLNGDPEVISDNLTAVKDLVRAIESEGDAAVDWAQGGSNFPVTTGVPKGVIADFLLAYAAPASDLVFADSVLGQWVRKNTRFLEWRVGFVNGNGQGPVALTETFSILKSVERKLLYDSSTGKHGVFKVSGKRSRLAGSEDMWRGSGLARPRLKEPEVYASMHEPVLLVYLVQGELDDPAKNPGLLAAIKIGIPGRPGAAGTDVRYMLNSVAAEQYASAGVEEISDDDFEDLDEDED